MPRRGDVHVLVTGGAGYVGVVLVAALLKKGYSVTLLDNFMYGYDSILHLADHPRLTVVRQDIRNPLKHVARQQDVIFHLAGISGFPACQDNPSAAKAINVAATRRFLKDLSPRQLVIYASTTSFYGDSAGTSDERSRVKPVSLYGLTKYQAEQQIMQRGNAISLRFATIFGVSPRMRTDLLVNDFVRRAIYERYIVLFEAATTRTFVHIQDAVQGYLFALEKASMKGNVYNVGDESLNFTKLQIAEAIKKQTGCDIVTSGVADFDVRNFVTSFAKIRKLGYHTDVSLADGVRELIKLYSFYQPYPTFHTI